jgi:TetR/AcrR family transcriptional repressor of nem operon
MRYPADHKQATRERIVRAAARQFRSRGGDGAGIADLMKQLRLTHGGFYRHFTSKEALFAEAFDLSLNDAAERVERAIERAPAGGELKALVDAYLDIEHCDDVAGGCPVAALASEVARRTGGARERYLDALRRHVRRIAPHVPGRTDEERIEKTIALLSGMAGTLTIARAFRDKKDRQRVLDAGRKFYLAALTR